jgi:hypothetical protein
MYGLIILFPFGISNFMSFIQDFVLEELLEASVSGIIFPIKFYQARVSLLEGDFVLAIRWRASKGRVLNSVLTNNL